VSAPATRAALDREVLRVALGDAAESGDLAPEDAADVLAAYDAGALELDRLPVGVRRRVERAAEAGSGDAAAALWALAFLALIPVARAAFPGAGVRWSWDARAARYQSAGGRELEPSILGRLVERTAESSASTLALAPARPSIGEGADLAAANRRRAAALSRWQATVEEELLARYVAMGAAGRGGLAQLGDDDREWIRAYALGEYHYLDGFRSAIDAAEGSGTLLTDAYQANRLRLYANRTRVPFFEMQRRAHAEAGFVFEINVLGVPEGRHCSECPRLTALGPVPLGTHPLPGTRECGGQCYCRLAYLRSTEDVQ
jgi:hypothetical protein